MHPNNLTMTRGDHFFDVSDSFWQVTIGGQSVVTVEARSLSQRLGDGHELHSPFFANVPGGTVLELSKGLQVVLLPSVIPLLFSTPIGSPGSGAGVGERVGLGMIGLGARVPGPVAS